MIMVRLMGGLGNQMFQYAFGRALSLKYDTELLLETGLLGTDGSNPGTVIRQYALSPLPVHARFPTGEEVDQFLELPPRNLLERISDRITRRRYRKLRIQRGHDFSESQLTYSDGSCLIGRWQSERYFADVKDQIRTELTPAIPLPKIATDLAGRICTTNSISLHIRRGDYCTHPEYSAGIGALPLSYYVGALDRAIKSCGEPEVFVFSDDPEWAKENLSLPCPHHHVSRILSEAEAGGELIELSLMMSCRHHIISNSTYSWWAAWLGEKEGCLCIAPRVWALSPDYLPPYILPPRWETLPA